MGFKITDQHIMGCMDSLELLVRSFEKRSE